MASNEERPSYVTFANIPVEDREATLRNGHYSTKDAEFVFVTPPGSKDKIPRSVEVWLADLEQGVRSERMKPEIVEQYKSALARWRKNEEVPLHGTPIKGWPILSPAQQTNILAANVLTVEDLAVCNGEARQRIGMGVEELVQKAKRWLETSKDVGRISLENERLAKANEQLSADLDAVTKELKRLAAKLDMQEV